MLSLSAGLQLNAIKPVIQPVAIVLHNEYLHLKKLPFKYQSKWCHKTALRAGRQARALLLASLPHELF